MNITVDQAQSGDLYRNGTIESVSADRKHIVIRFVGGGSDTMSLAQARLTTVVRPDPVPVAPITIDTTPAGIFAAMMRANASESAAPQDRLYGLLSDYLRRTLVHAYGIDADVVYHAIMSSGECSDDVISDTLADAAYLRGARGGRNYFVTAPSAIAYELRHVMQISRDWRQGMTQFATIGQHGSGYWTVTQGHTASGAPMELTDEPMILTCVTRFADSRQAQAAVRANGYR